jgi:serine/threonine-protein kinase
MPPEVIRGKASTTRSDVYRTGALLYRLLTGAPPGRGSNPLAIMQCLLEGQWDRDALDRAGVPPLLASVVHLCLATDPDERFPGAADLRDALALSGTLPPDGLPPDLAQLAARLTK